jgi:hypothetical protein
MKQPTQAAANGVLSSYLIFIEERELPAEPGTKREIKG